VVLIPVGLATAGIAWILSSLGVFVRDIGPAVALGVHALFFLTPIFYPLEVVPSPLRGFVELNPLTHSVEAVRNVLVWGNPPDGSAFGFPLFGSALLALVGAAVFAKSKRAFADVL